MQVRLYVNSQVIKQFLLYPIEKYRTLQNFEWLINLFSILHQLYSYCGQMAYKSVTCGSVTNILINKVVGNISEGDCDDVF